MKLESNAPRRVAVFVGSLEFEFKRLFLKSNDEFKL